MNLELHAKGASFVATQKENNPRDLVIKSLEKMPEAEVKEQFEQFRSLLEKNSDSYQRAVDWYFFVNMRDYLTSNRNRTQDPVERAQARVAHQEAVERIKSQIVMLDFLMPIGDGKPMRDCTGAEMAKLGNRYQKIAAKVGKTKTVGAVLSEEQVRELMK
jgi:hypothetical protein